MGIHHTSYHTGCRKGHLIHTARLFAEDMPPGTHFLDQSAIEDCAASACIRTRLHQETRLLFQRGGPHVVRWN
jgi:hypothetical protein